MVRNDRLPISKSYNSINKFVANILAVQESSPYAKSYLPWNILDKITLVEDLSVI
jgi:hypothetical protein